MSKGLVEWKNLGDAKEPKWEGWTDRTAYYIDVGKRAPFAWKTLRDDGALRAIARGKARTQGRAVGAGKRAAERDAKKGALR